MSQLPGKYPCAACGSSDGVRKYSDGKAFCFVCRNILEGVEKETVKADFKVTSKKLTVEEIASYPTGHIKNRGISKEIMTFFGVKVSYNESGNIDAHYYPYEGGKAYKIRKLPKDFSWVNKSHDLFGRTKFNGSNSKLIICEGEIDALSIA